MKQYLIAAAFALGIALNTHSTEYTLQKVKDCITEIDKSGGSITTKCPVVRDYSEIKGIVDALYKKVTGEEMSCCQIKILAPERMKEISGRFNNLGSNVSYTGLHFKDSILIQEDNLLKVLNDVGHELGHESYDRFNKKELNIDELLVEEAKAIAFNKMWNEELIPYVGGRINASAWEATTPLYPAATKLVEELTKAKGGKGAYENLKTEPVEKLVRTIITTKEYKKYASK